MNFDIPIAPGFARFADDRVSIFSTVFQNPLGLSFSFSVAHAKESYRLSRGHGLTALSLYKDEVYTYYVSFRLPLSQREALRRVL